MATLKYWSILRTQLSTYLPAHRWILASLGGFAAAGMMTAFALAPSGQDGQLQQHAVIEQLLTPTPTLIDPGSALYLHEERILRTDTLFSLIQRLGVTDTEALTFLLNDKDAQAISETTSPRQGRFCANRRARRAVSTVFPPQWQGRKPGDRKRPTFCRSRTDSET